MTPQPTPAPHAPRRYTFGDMAGAVIVGGIFVLAVIAVVGYLVLRKVEPPPEPITLTVDANTPPHVGRRILLHADTKGGLVKWQVLTAPVDNKKYDLWAEQGNSHDANLTTPFAGDYRIQGITVVGGEADVAEIHVLIDLGPTPIPPGPGPTPPGPTPTPIPQGQLRVLMTYDPNVNVTQGQLTVLKSAATQKLVPTGNWRVFPTDETFGDELPIWKDVFGKRKNKVGMVLFDGNSGNIVYEGDLPNSMADAQALIKKWGG